MNPKNVIQKVVFVDDDDNIRFLARMALQGLTSWEVHDASSGMAALTLVSSVRPDVILLDIMMPGMDGIQVYQQLQRNPKTANIPVIFITAKVQTDEVETYLRVGAAGVITKPFDPLALPEEIVRIFQRYAELRRHTHAS